MAPRRKYQRQQRQPIKETSVAVCSFCGLAGNVDPEGELLLGNGFKAHYFCMLFSSGLHQRGEVSSRLRGFIESDVKAELQRGARLKCAYCKHTRATVGCCLKACKRVFHLRCGITHQCLFQYFGDFRAYCPSHRPKQNLVPIEQGPDIVCLICTTELDPRPSPEVLVTPCCRHSLHRECIERQASSAGSHFFKCCHCNNKEEFQGEMQAYGIFIPDRDASWELEENAYSDLLFRYSKCDALRCKCPFGREANIEDSLEWTVLVCATCGSQGIHACCGNLVNSTQSCQRWLCRRCRGVIVSAVGKPDGTIAVELPPGKGAPAKESTSELVGGASNHVDHIATRTEQRVLRSNPSASRQRKSAPSCTRPFKRKAATRESNGRRAKRQSNIQATCSTSTAAEGEELSANAKTLHATSRPTPSEPLAAANDSHVLQKKDHLTEVSSMVVTCRNGKLCAAVKPRLSGQAASLLATSPMPSSSKDDCPTEIPTSENHSEAAVPTKMVHLRPPEKAKAKRVRNKPSQMPPGRSSGIQLSLLTFLRQFMQHTPEQKI